MRNEPYRFIRRGGYPAGTKPVALMRQPPRGPAPGAKPKDSR